MFRSIVVDALIRICFLIQHPLRLIFLTHANSMIVYIVPDEVSKIAIIQSNPWLIDCLAFTCLGSRWVRSFSPRNSAALGVRKPDNTMKLSLLWPLAS